MFKRPHHQRIAELLKALDGSLLERAECYFGGGTAIVLALGEYRESVDVDFICSSTEGYRLLRNTIRPNDLGDLLIRPMTHVRDVRASQYSISTYLDVSDTPIKIEFVRESRIGLAGAYDATLGVPVLSRVDMYAEKLLANADRGLDKWMRSRDLIDIAMMIKHWGPIPQKAWSKAQEAYGDYVVKLFESSRELIRDSQYLADCLQSMKMDPSIAEWLPEILGVTPERSSLDFGGPSL